MDPFEKRELKRKAWMRLAAQRRRAGLLRGRVVVISLLCFAVLWGVVFAQMATGNDPVLSAKEKPATRTAATAKGEVETTDPRELEPKQRAHRQARSDDEEAVEAEPEPPAEAEPEFEEEAVAPEPEPVEAEPEFVEPEPEPLVTSQS